ncbi:uncharacterized protein [Symphalangus syndactylus]|uniref:uncharacterized protein n=1 Tax=Symphalangus syndactylus TaxID=9590 RepID=UPI00300502AD
MLSEFSVLDPICSAQSKKAAELRRGVWKAPVALFHCVASLGPRASTSLAGDSPRTPASANQVARYLPPALATWRGDEAPRPEQGSPRSAGEAAEPHVCRPSRGRPEGRAPTPWEPNAGVAAGAELLSRVSLCSSWRHLRWAPHVPLLLHRPVLPSLPPAQELLFYHWPGLKFGVLTGTDALGHDAPPTAACSGVAHVTESRLLQLFHVTVPFTESVTCPSTKHPQLPPLRLAQSGATVILSLQEAPGAWPSLHLLLSGPLPQPRGSRRKTPPRPSPGLQPQV